jgi:hypothetical protein
MVVLQQGRETALRDFKRLEEYALSDGSGGAFFEFDGGKDFFSVGSIVFYEKDMIKLWEDALEEQVGFVCLKRSEGKTWRDLSAHQVALLLTRYDWVLGQIRGVFEGVTGG